MSRETKDGIGYAVTRLLINLGALALTSALIALIIATIVAETD